MFAKTFNKPVKPSIGIMLSAKITMLKRIY